MQAQIEVGITQHDVWIELQNREFLHVYIDSVEQDAAQTIC